MKNNKKNIVQNEYTLNRVLKLAHNYLQTSAPLTADYLGLTQALRLSTNANINTGEMLGSLPTLQLKSKEAKSKRTAPTHNNSLELVKIDAFVKANKKILPMFITPVNLKKKDDIKKNKLSLDKINPEKRLTYKNISLIQILKKKLQKIENYSYNLKNNFSFHTNIGFFTLTGSFR